MYRNKDILINQAKEARLARELARRQDEAATTIQAYLKGHLIRTKLKEDVRHQLKLLAQDSCEASLDDIFKLIGRLILFCDFNKDKDLFQSSFQLIIDMETNTNLNKSKDMGTPQIRYNENQIKLLNKIVDLCIRYLMTIDNTAKTNLVQLSIQLKLINTLADIFDYEWNHKKTVIEKLIINRYSFIKCITNLISQNLNSGRIDLRGLILENYIDIFIKLVLHDINSMEQLRKLDEFTTKSASEELTSLFSIPGIIHFIQKYSIQALDKLNVAERFSIYSFLLSQFCHKSSSTSLFILANFIHLIKTNEAAFIENKSLSILLIIDLLNSCQNDLGKNRSLNGTITDNKSELSGDTKKRNEPVNVSFHPLLGWLTEKHPVVMDRDVIKSQLSYMWSSRMIKLIFKDLLDEYGKPSTNIIVESPIDVASRDKLCSSIRKSNQKQRNLNSSPTNAPANLLRRAVERVSLSIPKSVTSTYTKLSIPSNFDKDKLWMTKANYLSQACCLFNTAIQTLTMIKTDIIGSLCLHDSLITNLWRFISSLSPYNGLIALLENLNKSINPNPSLFSILILFCECASHLINVLDDSELYEKQQPLTLTDLILIGNLMNNFVFRCICDNYVAYDQVQSNPLIHATHTLLTDLYKRDCRRNFTPVNHWLIKDIRIPNFLKDLEVGKPIAKTIITLLPHSIPHKERVLIFRKLVAKDRAQNCNQLSTLITIHRSRIVEDGYQQLSRLQPHALKGLIRVKFINDHGLDEAGIDQDGVFKEFLEDTIKKIFDPQLNLFSTTNEQCLYPSPTSRLHENHLSLFKFVGKMIGKALYDGIVVDVPFALFFLSRVLGQAQSPLYSPIDELPSLDLELYKSLTYLKHYEADVSDLDLTFSIDQDFMGKIETYELEPGGKSIQVTNETRIRYIHSVANFRMRKQIEKQTEAFVSGFKTIIDLDWLSMFSTSEFQRLISGDNNPIDLQDLRRNTTYYGGFHNNHRVVCWLWDILDNDFNAQEQSLFLKFVTSCSKPPLLGFSNLEPPFSVRCVEVGDDQDPGDTLGSVVRVLIGFRRSTDPVDRLPTSSTCFNLLKLPNYHRRNTLRDKLRYAIRSNPGFELS